MLSTHNIGLVESWLDKIIHDGKKSKTDQSLKARQAKHSTINRHSLFNHFQLFSACQDCRQLPPIQPRDLRPELAVNLLGAQERLQGR